MKREHDSRTALVTGGSRGIGRAICVALAREGARVAINYNGNREAAEETRAVIVDAGGTAEIFQADVSDADAVAKLANDVENSLGAIDLLVTNAGLAIAEHHSAMTFQNWKAMMGVNVDGTYLPVMAVKDGMIERQFGRIVCISSIAALRPRSQMIAYSAGKAAVVAFARNCAAAFSPHVRVNCVAPGLIDTDMGNALGEEAVARLADEAWLKRIGQPEEIAELTCFLLSDKSSFTTGQTIVADGGGRATLP